LFTSSIRTSTLLRVTETGGEVGLVRVLPGAEADLVRTLVDALGGLDAGFAAFAGQLETGAVHEHAFGKLIDAAKVRDAYHERLPATRVNLAEAGEVARSLLAEFAGLPAADAPVPAQDAQAEPSPPAEPAVAAPVPAQREAGAGE
jgi:hypothetical protein